MFQLKLLSPTILWIFLLLWINHCSMIEAVEESNLVSIWNETNNALVHPVDPATFLPLFWHIPKSGGTTMKSLVNCLGLVSASQVGSPYQSGQLEVVQLGSGAPDATRTALRNRVISTLNVDVASHKGIQHAHNLGFAAQTPPWVPDVVLTPLVHPASGLLFSTTKPGQLFALFRHPVERTVSLFYYLQQASWEDTYRPEWANITLLDFYKDAIVGGEGAERDWMTRLLIGKAGHGTLTDQDLEHAKKIVSDKLLVGFTHDVQEAFRRFGVWLGWNSLPSWYPCVQELARHGSNANEHPNFPPESQEYQLIAQVNRFDMELYEHVQIVYEEQTVLFEKVRLGQFDRW